MTFEAYESLYKEHEKLKKKLELHQAGELERTKRFLLAIDKEGLFNAGVVEGERRALERVKDAYLLHCKKWGVEPVHFLSELGLVGEEEKR